MGVRMVVEEVSADTELRTYFKQQAAGAAVEFLQSGMVIGLGTGSTAIFATRRIARFLRDGRMKDVICFATSKAVWEEACRLGIPMMAEEMPRAIDITIDGADEIDPDLNLIKGGGGALLREKVVAQASRRVIIVADSSKLSPRLGAKRPLPVEVLSFGWLSQLHYMESLCAKVEPRVNADRSPFITDSGNMILDCQFGPIANPADLAVTLSARAGIVEHGLFLRMATDAIVAGSDGIRHVVPNEKG